MWGFLAALSLLFVTVGTGMTAHDLHQERLEAEQQQTPIVEVQEIQAD